MVDSPLAYYRRVRGKQAYVRAQALSGAGKAAEAAEAYDLAAGLSGDDAEMKRAAVLAAADLYQTLGRASETAERAEQLATLAPTDPDAILRLARARDLIGRRDDAAAAWVRRLELAPDCEQAPQRLAELLSGVAAVPHLRALAEKTPDDLSAWIRLGETLTAEGDFDGAAVAWKRRLALAPSCDEAPRRLADLLRGAEALPHIRTLAERAPHDLAAWDRLTNAAEAAGDVGTEAIGWRRIVELEPGDLAARRRLIELLTRMERHADAARQLDAAVALEPAASELWSALARACAGADDTEGELRGWRGAVEAAPTDPMARSELVRALQTAGRNDEATPHLVALADQQPGSAKAALRAARAVHAEGRADAAAGLWARALSIAPDILEAHRGLAAWRRARKEPAEALPHLRFEAEHAGGVKAFKTLALTLEQLGDLDQAEMSWRRVLDANPAHLDALARVVALSRKRGAPGEAISALRAASAAIEDPAAVDRLVQLQLDAGDLVGAVATRRRAFDTRPHDTPAVLALARLQNKTGDLAGSIATLQAAVDARPDDLECVRALVHRRARAGDAAGAIASLHRAADAYPGALQLVAEMAPRLEGDRDGLAGLLDRAAQASPEDPDLLRALARSAAGRGDMERAVTLWSQLLAVAPNDPEAARAVGLHLYDIGQRAAAAPHLAIAGSAAPTDLKVWRRLAWAARGDDDHEREIAVLRHLLAHITPDDEETKLRLIEILIDSDRRPEAEPLLSEMADKRHDDVRLRTTLARARRDLGDAAGSLDAWRRALEVNPAEPDANAAVGEEMLVSGDLVTAIDHLARAAPAATKPAVAWKRIAKLRRQAKDHDGELIALQNLVAAAAVKDPGDHRRLAMLLEAHGRHGEAAPYLEVILAQRPHDLGALRRVAYARRVNGDIEGEAEAWGRILDRQPGDPDALMGLARWRIATGELEQATGLLTEAGDAVTAEAWIGLATAWAARADAGAEIEAWRQVLAIEPARGEAHQRLAELLIGMGAGREAAPHLAIGVEASPEDHRLREHYGLVLHGAGQLKEAATQLQAAAEARPTIPKPWKRLGRVLAEAGDLEGAAKAWRHVLALGADDQEASEALGRLLQRLGRFDEAATYLRGRAGPAIEALAQSEDGFQRLGDLNAAFAQADIKLLDIGARGGPLDWMTLLAPHTTYYACEPERVEAERLAGTVQATHPWRQVQIVPEGLGGVAGEATLSLTSHSGFSSIYRPNAAMAERFGLASEMGVTGEVTIPLITLAEAAARYGFEDLGVLKIDTQGSELEVLKGGEALLRDAVQAVYAEVEFREFYEGQPLFGDVDSYLRGLGFELLRLEPVSRRRVAPGRKLAYSRHEVVWAHVLYVKPAPDAAALPPVLFLKRTLQQMAIAVAYELFDLAADLALAPEAQSAFAAAGLKVTIDDIDAFAQAGLARSLLKDFAERWPDQIKNVPKPYTG